MKNGILFIILLVTAGSCKSKIKKNCRATVDVTFIDASDHKSDLIVSNGTDSVAINGEAHTTQKTVLCFDKAPEIDGHYTIHLKNKHKDTVINWGYYTNGYPFESKLSVTFQADTLAVKSINHY